MSSEAIALWTLILGGATLVVTAVYQIYSVRKSRREEREKLYRHVEAVTVEPTRIQSAGEGTVRA